MSDRRKVGDRVWVEGAHWFGPHAAQWGTILDNDDSDGMSCWLCNDEDCRDWPDVKLDDGGMAYHVYECEMHDGRD